MLCTFFFLEQLQFTSFTPNYWVPIYSLKAPHKLILSLTKSLCLSELLFSQLENHRDAQPALLCSEPGPGARI